MTLTENEKRTASFGCPRWRACASGQGCDHVCAVHELRAINDTAPLISISPPMIPPLTEEQREALREGLSRITSLAMLSESPYMSPYMKAQREFDARASGATILQNLRDAGWMVAAHNDYYQHGELHTFWLLTYGDKNENHGMDGTGVYIKGEGKSDLVALAICEEQAAKIFAPSP